jgi:putative redox protein
MSDKKITAHITETDKSDYAVEIKVNGHTLYGDEPKFFGGGNTGTAPYDMLLAALGECTARWCAGMP